jgi:hypothetical protein
MKIPEEYQKIAHRYDQFKQVECTVYYGYVNNQGTYFVEANEKLAGPFTRSEIEVIMDCLKNDIDFKRPAL